jgi:anti-sigma B factor antagonist
LDGKTEVVADFGDVKYVSSAGIRELLSLYKTMKAKGGSFSIINAGESIKEVFEITGFWDLLSGG